MTTCINDAHDHTMTEGPEGETLAEPVAAYCFECGDPAHFDEQAGQWYHDDGDHPGCFVVGVFGGDDGSTPCEMTGEFSPTCGTCGDTLEEHGNSGPRSHHFVRERRVGIDV